MTHMFDKNIFFFSCLTPADILSTRSFVSSIASMGHPMLFNNNDNDNYYYSSDNCAYENQTQNDSFPELDEVLEEEEYDEKSIDVCVSTAVTEDINIMNLMGKGNDMLANYSPYTPNINNKIISHSHSSSSPSIAIANEKPPLLQQKNIQRILLQSENQNSNYHRFPAVHYQSLDHTQSLILSENSSKDAILSNNETSKKPCINSSKNISGKVHEFFKNSVRLAIKCTFMAFNFCKKLIQFISFPIRLLLQCTIPSCDFQSEWEFLYPLSAIMSSAWIIVFSIIIVCISHHWYIQYQFSLAFLGLIVISIPLALPSICDCIPLSLQGYSSQVILQSYHIQLANFAFGIAIPVFIFSLVKPVLQSTTS